MPSYPGPFGLRWTVSWDGLIHKAELLINVDEDTPIGTAPSAIVTHLRNGAEGLLSDFIIDFMTPYRQLFNTASSIGNVTLWKYTPDSYDATFWASSTYSQLGLSASANVIAGYVMYTFRSFNGGIAKLLTLEGRYNQPLQRNYAELDGEEQDVVDVLIAGTSPIVARDNGYLLGFNLASGGQNEKVFRQRYRP